MRSGTSVMYKNAGGRSQQGAGQRNNWFRGDKYKHGKCKSLTKEQIKALGYQVS